MQTVRSLKNSSLERKAMMKHRSVKAIAAALFVVGMLAASVAAQTANGALV